MQYVDYYCVVWWLEWEYDKFELYLLASLNKMVCLINNFKTR